MSVAPQLWTEPRARADSPWTSWAAARSVTGLREKQAAVLYVLTTDGPLSLSQLVQTYQELFNPYGEPKQSPSGIRTRAKELQVMGLIVADGFRVNDNGNRERLLHTNLSVAVTARGEALHPPEPVSPRAVTGTGENQ